MADSDSNMRVTTNNGAEVRMNVPENVLVIKHDGTTDMFYNPSATAALQILILQELVWLNMQLQTLTNRA